MTSEIVAEQDVVLLLSRSFRHLKIHCLESLQEKGCKMGLVKIYSLEPLLEESQKYALLKWQKLRDNNKAISILLAENVMPTASGAIANK